MKLIMERMKSFSEGLPVVFVGDHNDGPKSEMTAIARKFLKDARDISEKTSVGQSRGSVCALTTSMCRTASACATS